ncbi:hypothetical protein CEXT_717231 [Caerostris extrusa]|uniref:Uncharacterized protein n=1 Tax=Caerostris extrusa TaxID=172846 RepID=A0AAV4WS33_CAEEX|nr:hypothetical protein CEXT_717231 [Caerostris extrusa]
MSISRICPSLPTNSWGISLSYCYVPSFFHIISPAPKFRCIYIPLQGMEYKSLPPNLKPIQSLPTSTLKTSTRRMCVDAFSKRSILHWDHVRGPCFDVARSHTLDVMYRAPPIVMPLTRHRTSNSAGGATINGK